MNIVSDKQAIRNAYCPEPSCSHTLPCPWHTENPHLTRYGSLIYTDSSGDVYCYDCKSKRFYDHDTRTFRDCGHRP